MPDRQGGGLVPARGGREGPAEEETVDQPQGWPRWVYAFGRLVGFLILTLPAVAILAALILLPEYTAWKQEVYRRDCAAVRTANLESFKEAQEKMVLACYDDPVHIKRLADSICNLKPANEQVLPSGLPPAPLPGMVTGQPHAPPPEPNDQLIRLGAKVSPSDPDTATTRRGLFLVSLALLLFAVLLFGPAARRRKAQPEAPQAT